MEKLLLTRDGVASFLFWLMRDHVPPGQVEEIVRKLEETGARTVCFDPPAHHLGAYAIALAARIRACDAAASEEIIDEGLLPHLRFGRPQQ